MVKKTKHFQNDIGVEGIVANGSIGAPGNALLSDGVKTYWGPGAGFTGSKGETGDFGGASFDYAFNTTITNTDPGTGFLKFNNSNLTLATNLYIDDEDDSSADIQQYLRTIDDSTSTIKGHFKVSIKADPSQFVIYTISSLVENAGYFDVTCSYIDGSTTSFANNSDIIITFARTGDKGEIGFTGSQGVIGFTGSKGDIGSQGVIGFTGSASTAVGPTGFTGSKGDIGFTGSTGPIAGTNSQVIYNNGGVAGGAAGLLYDDVNSRVAVNLTFANAPLEVGASATTSSNIAYFSNSSGSQKAIIRLDAQGDGELVLRDAGNNEDVLLSAGGDSYLNGGNVGIGTSNPIDLLHVRSGDTGRLWATNSRTIAVIEGTTSSGTVLSIISPDTGYSGIFFGDDAEENTGQIQYDHATNQMRFITNSTEKLRIGAAGGVTALNGPGTIANATWDNGWLKVGTNTAGWSMDPNELYSAGAATIGSLSGSLAIRTNDASNLNISTNSTIRTTISGAGLITVSGNMVMSGASFTPERIIPTNLTDFNSAITTPNTVQFIRGPFQTINRPPDANWHTGIHLRHPSTADYSTQIMAGSSLQNQLWLRNNVNGTWEAWAEIYHDDYHPIADALTTARDIELSGDVTGTASFDGSADINIVTSLDSNYIPLTTGGTYDINSALASGAYIGSTANFVNRGPSSSNAGGLLTFNTHPGDYYSQFWFNTSGGATYIRHAANVLPTGTWQRLYADDYHPEADAVGGIPAAQIPYATGGIYGSTNTAPSSGGIGADAIRRSMFFRDRNEEFTSLGLHIQHASHTDYAFQFGVESYTSASGNISARLLNNGTWETPVNLIDNGASAQTKTGNFTAARLTASSGSLVLSGALARADFRETDQAVDEKNWSWLVDDSNMALRLYNDALTSYTGPIKIDRNGTTSDLITLSPDTLMLDTDILIPSTGSMYKVNTSQHGYVAQPTGGFLNGPVNTVGAIKISLPVHGPTDMLSFWVDIYDYTAGESISIFVSGHVYQTTGNIEWIHPTVTILSSFDSSKDYTVRFGGDGTNNCIWIGELDSTWEYPQVLVRDVQCGSTATAEHYSKGWAVAVVTAFDTVGRIVSNNFPVAQKLGVARNIALSGDVTGSASFDGSGDISIISDVSNITGPLTVDGTITGSTLTASDADVGLNLKAGDTYSVFAGDQIRFGYNGTDDYRHSIGTRHSSSTKIYNAIDFYLWDYGTDAAASVGTYKVLTLDQTSSVLDSPFTIVTQSSTIGGTSWNNGWLKIGSAVAGWAIDSNEIYGAAAATIGTITGQLDIKTVDTSNLVLSTNNTSRMFINGTTGYVGIGSTTSTPEGQLQIISTAAGTDNFWVKNSKAEWDLKIVEKNSGTANLPLFSLGLYYQNTTSQCEILFERGSGSTDGEMSFSTNGTERMRIDDKGRVGIGVLDPQTDLDVDGEIKTTGLITATGGVTLGSGADLTLQGLGALLQHTNVSSRDKLRVWNTSTYTIGMQNFFNFGGLTNNFAMTFQMSDTDGRGFWWGDTTHTQGQGAMSVTTNGKLTVAHSIRVGFGESDTTTPGTTHDLEVSGTASVDGGIEVGYRAIPRSTTTTTVAVGDNGKCIALTSNITVPASTFSAGDAVTLYNNGATSLTITQGTGLTLRLAGSATTGNRTLVQRGLCTLWFNSATEAIISGAGLA